MAWIKGKWRWNEVVNCDYQAHSEYHLNFKSNKIKFDTLKLEWYVGKHELYYWSLNDKVYILAGISANMNEDFYSVKEEYRIMDFGETEQEISEELYAFILANATEYSPIAEKLVEVANNVPKVFEAGKQQGHGEGYESGYNAGLEEGKELGGYNEGFEAGKTVGKQEEYDTFWDGFQNHGGEAHSYQRAFAGYGWNDNTFKPKYNLVFAQGYTGNEAFWDNHTTNIAEVLENRGLIINTTLCGSATGMFQLSQTVRIPELNFAHAMDYNSNGLYMTFQKAKVETIDKLIVPENLKYVNAFKECANLKNIAFDGVIGQDINFQWSTLLTRASIESIVNALSDSATGKTLTLSKAAVDKAFETSEGANDGASSQEWDSLEGLKMNWQITLV